MKFSTILSLCAIFRKSMADSPQMYLRVSKPGTELDDANIFCSINSVDVSTDHSTPADPAYITDDGLLIINDYYISFVLDNLFGMPQKRAAWPGWSIKDGCLSFVNGTTFARGEHNYLLKAGTQMKNDDIEICIEAFSVDTDEPIKEFIPPNSAPIPDLGSIVVGKTFTVNAMKNNQKLDSISYSRSKGFSIYPGSVPEYFFITPDGFLANKDFIYLESTADGLFKTDKEIGSLSGFSIENSVIVGQSFYASGHDGNYVLFAGTPSSQDQFEVKLQVGEYKDGSSLSPQSSSTKTGTSSTLSGFTHSSSVISSSLVASSSSATESSVLTLSPSTGSTNTVGITSESASASQTKSGTRTSTAVNDSGSTSTTMTKTKNNAPFVKLNLELIGAGLAIMLL